MSIQEGYHTTYSSTLDAFNLIDPTLMHSGSGSLGCWCSLADAVGEWSQVSFNEVKTVKAITTMGCNKPVGGNQYYVKKYRLEYSLDGSTWLQYNNGEVLAGNADITTLVTH